MLQGLDKEWPSLHSLVVHLTVMPEMLPCTLRLPKQRCSSSAAFQDGGRREAADPSAAAAAAAMSPSALKLTRTGSGCSERRTGLTAAFRELSARGALDMASPESEDEDYQRLSDFSSIMADLRVK